jgi:polygalacturonase
MRRLAIQLSLTLASVALSDPPLPVIPPNTFNVADYGAVGDGTTDNESAIQAAIDDARSAGGGTVEIPAAAQPYESGPLTLYSNINLQIDDGAVLQALPFGIYPGSTTSPPHFITVSTGSTNVEISGTGAGTIDGNGIDWWTAFLSHSITARPRLVQINHADTLLITGVTFSNSPSFHLAFNATTNVTIDGVTITAPVDAPNTDGIDPAGTHYLIQNCNISVGDDNIAVKPGSTFNGDITITNCAFGTGHGLSIGGQTNRGLNGMNVSNCTFDGTITGLRMKADATEGGLVENVTYSDITMTDVQYPIVFYSYYNRVGSPGATSGSQRTTPARVNLWNANPPNPLSTTTLPGWRNIAVHNLTATGASGYSIIWGLPLPDYLIANVTLDNVSISGGAGFEIYDATNVQFTGNSSVGSFVTDNSLAITSQPQSQTVVAGSDVSISVGTAGTSGVNGTAPSYQWALNGVPLSDGTMDDGSVVSGANTATLLLSSVQFGEAGDYTAVVSNSLDGYDVAAHTLMPDSVPISASSSVATLTVTVP